MAEPSTSPDDPSVVALLASRSREERVELLEDLVALLVELAPEARVERSLLKRRVTSFRLPLGDYLYVLARGSGNAFEASRQHVVGGVAVRTVRLEIDAFLEELALALDEELRRTERGRERLLAWVRAAPR
jgi:hypothetical protein